MPSDQDNDDEQSVGKETTGADTLNVKAFRFKRAIENERDEKHRGFNTATERRRRHRHHHGRHKRRRLSSETLPSTSSLPPDVAFRESLFDAMGDDEGAEFWQSVYGQPIHTYPRTYQDSETGVLETMDDEQYAQYVRRKMWERSTEGIEAAREAKRREKKERRREEEEEEEERKKSGSQGHTESDFLFNHEIEASLKRGQTRKDKKRWRQVWQDYLSKWKDLQEIYESRKGTSADDSEQIFLRNKIAWPVESGQRKHIASDEIEKFVDNVSASQETEELDQASIKASIVKFERVRWHPDKVQQRYGFMEIEQSTIEGVTAVFQVLDRMWNEIRHHHP